MDQKTREQLDKVFTIAREFAEEKDLMCQCRVATATNGNEICLKTQAGDTAVYWDVNVKSGWTGTKVELTKANHMDSWDGGAYNVNSFRGKKRLKSFLDKEFSSYKNTKGMQAKWG